MKRVALPQDTLWFLTMGILAEGFQTSHLAMRCKCEIPGKGIWALGTTRQDRKVGKSKAGRRHRTQTKGSNTRMSRGGFVRVK